MGSYQMVGGVPRYVRAEGGQRSYVELLRADGELRKEGVVFLCFSDENYNYRML